MWHWLTQTDAGLATRIGAGVLIFAMLALIDLRRNGHSARRWREYLFLLLCVSAAMAYGIVNDLITSSISWEYFCYGKGLWPEILHDVPPDPAKLRLAAAVVGMKATWTAGLIGGVVLLIANNPSHERHQLSFAALMRLLFLVLIAAAVTAVVLGVAGGWGLLTWYSHDFAEMVRRNEMRPYRFMTTFGIHLGGYVGAFWGLVAAVIVILHRRIAFKSVDKDRTP
ncbi:MAG TPA: hypothetical protein VH518_24840 [Tepidisphaeraceae bacterium]